MLMWYLGALEGPAVRFQVLDGPTSLFSCSAAPYLQGDNALLTQFRWLAEIQSHLSCPEVSQDSSEPFASDFQPQRPGSREGEGGEHESAFTLYGLPVAYASHLEVALVTRDIWISLATWVQLSSTPTPVFHEIGVLCSWKLNRGPGSPWRS